MGNEVNRLYRERKRRPSHHRAKYGRVEETESAYICGCDGARSCVRETLGVGFPGGTYEQLFYVADVKIARGFSRDLYINLGKHILTLMFPVRSSGMQRLIGLVPPELSHHEKLGFEDIRAPASSRFLTSK